MAVLLACSLPAPAQTIRAEGDPARTTSPVPLVAPRRTQLADRKTSPPTPGDAADQGPAASAGWATAPCELQTLTASDAPGIFHMGLSLSLTGDTAVVGAWTENCLEGTGCGSAYIYRYDRTMWVQEQKLTAPDAAPYDSFGFSVSLSGENAVVGAPYDDCSAGMNCGSAYLYRYVGGTWVLAQKVTASDAAADARFGSSVSASGSRVIVGAPRDDCPGGSSCGSAYIFRYDAPAWIEEQKLTASDVADYDHFAASVSLSGDTAVVGAEWGDGPTGIDCGAAYTYHYDGTAWDEGEKLIASDAGRGDRFGYSVAVRDDTAVVGATGVDCPRGSWCGSAYIFRYNGATWLQEHKLIPSDAADDDLFGVSVSVSADRVIVGAPNGACPYGPNCGSASAYVYRYHRTNWVQEQKLTVPDAPAGYAFGGAVALSDEIAIVGAISDFCPAGSDCGSAYIFALGPDCQGNGVADACDIRDGGVPDGDHNGIPDECEPVAVELDIRPGACPNPLNPRSRGVLPAAIRGGPSLNVAEIDVDSLVLTRADGIGGSVRPLPGPPGTVTRLDGTVSHAAAPLVAAPSAPTPPGPAAPAVSPIVATPPASAPLAPAPTVDTSHVAAPIAFRPSPELAVAPTSAAGLECECPDPRSDGLDDLPLKFSTDELVESLELGDLSPGTSVKLTLTGSLHTGRPLEASDCILLTGGKP